MPDEIPEYVVLLHEVPDGSKLRGCHKLIPQRPNTIKNWVFPPFRNNFQLYFMIIFLLHFFLQVGKFIEVLNKILSLTLPFSIQIFLYPIEVLSVFVLIEMPQKLKSIQNELLCVHFFCRSLWAIGSLCC